MPNLELYIAGPAKPFREIEGVHWLGLLKSDELSKYFNLCDIFCMPSMFEAYGLVFIEALTYGLPCIGFNKYEMPYFIENGKNGYLLSLPDEKELAALMLNLIDNEEIKKYVRSKKNWYIKEYSWDTVCEKIYAVIQRNIDSKK